MINGMALSQFWLCLVVCKVSAVESIASEEIAVKSNTCKGSAVKSIACKDSELKSNACKDSAIESIACKGVLHVRVVQ